MAGYSTPAWTNDAAPAIDAAALTAMGQGIELSEHPYGVCSTGSSAAAKTVTIDFSGTLVLFTGMTIRVKFPNGNSAASPTLNVNGTGAIAMEIAQGIPIGRIFVGETIELIYDGASWRLINGEDRKTILRFTGVNVLVSNPAAEIIRINDTRITNRYVALNIIWSTPGYIKSNVTWETGSGYFSASGICSSAITCAVILAAQNVL